MTGKKVRPSATPEIEGRYRTIEATQRGVYNDTESRLPPVVTTGVVAWVRDNLFKTPFDTIVTIVALIIVTAVTVNIMSWAINDANWLVITRNLRQFMVGSYPVEQLWRINAVVLAIAFAIGFTWYAFNDKLSKKLVGTLAVGVALMLLIPMVVQAVVPPIGSYLAVGTTPIVSGSVTERPLELLSFVGQANEVVEISLASEASQEETIPSLAGFLDRASNAVLNNARNRITTQEQIVTLERQLAGDLLTDSQRAALETQLGNLSVPAPVSETYAINSAAVDVEIIDGSTLEVLVSGTIDAESEPLTYTLPQDGWYILRKVISGAEAGAETPIAIIRTTGIYPVIERNFTRPRAVGAPERILQYIRLTDDYATEAIRPAIDGTNTPVMFITDHQYRGERPFSDYMRIAGAPFLTQLSRGLIPMAILAVVGYLAGAGLVAVGHRSTFERRQNESPRQPAQTAANWIWILILVLGFPLIYGINNLDVQGASILIAQIIWVGWMFFVGIHLNRKWGVPLFGLLLVIGVGMAFFAEGLENSTSPSAAVGVVALFALGLFVAKVNGKLGGANQLIRTILLGVAVIFVLLMEPIGIDVSVTGLIGVAVWLLVGFYATNMGISRRMSWNSRKAFIALVGSGVLWLAALILPNLILSASEAGTNLLPVTDTRGWGGLLLTMMLTVVAILASFPLGVLLALGRRSDLPVVKGVCIFYIELVRGVPLITVLFMAQLLVPLVNPALASVDNVFRAMVGLTLFSAAYLAENVRGGLQSVPHGQEEAAKAVGLNGMQTILLITLPQALRAVIPALVGQCIALFKDTSLVALVGLIDLTGTARTTIAQPEFVGMQGEVYLFISVIYFIISYMMAYVSRRIEFSGSGAANNRNV